VKAAGSDARPLPRGAALARMTGVLFQGRKTALPFAKLIFREGGRGVLDLGDWGVARTSLCVKKCQLGGVKGKGDNAPYRASIALCEMTPTPAVPSSPVKWPAHGPLYPGRGGYRNIARTSLCVKRCQLGRLMDRYALAEVDTGT
jgi:hypothetical protein